MRFLSGLLVILVVAYAGACVYLFATQRSMIYFPMPESSFPDAVALRVETGGADLKIWRIGQVSGQAIIYFGGNAEDVGASIGDFAAVLPSYTVYLVNYRGYGGSTGTPSEDGLYHDALFLYDYLQPRFADISIVARSLGTGVATFVAAQRRVKQLVLVSPFDSLAAVAQSHFSLFPVSMLLYERYDSTSRADRIRGSTLVLLAGNDEIIPRDSSMRLVEAMSGADVVVEVIEGATHNTIGDDFRYLQLIGEFLNHDTEPE